MRLRLFCSRLSQTFEPFQEGLFGPVQYLQPPGECFQRFRSAGIDPGDVMLQTEIAESSDRRRHLFDIAGDRIRSGVVRSREREIAAGRADERGRITAHVDAGGVDLVEQLRNGFRSPVPIAVPGVGVLRGKP